MQVWLESAQYGRPPTLVGFKERRKLMESRKYKKGEFILWFGILVVGVVCLGGVVVPWRFSISIPREG